MGADNNIHTQGYVLYTRRWYILAVFCLVVCCQNAFWNTFGAIEPYAITYYHSSKSMINFLSSLGPIVFVPTSLVAVWFVDKFGLRATVIVTAALCGSGALIRCIYIDGFEYNIMFPIIGQTLNNAAGPMSMILQPKLSSVWFAPSERTLATAIGFQANVIGLSASYLLSMSVEHPHQIPVLLYIYAAGGVVTFLLTVIYFPNKPPSPPSFTGEQSSGICDTSPISVLKDSWQAMTCSVTAFILIVFGSCPGGVYSAWGAMIVEIVTPLGYVGNQAEWLGFWAMIAGGVGGVLVGKVHDIFKHYKILLIVIYIADVGVFVWFTLLTSHHFLHGSYGLVLFVNILGGFLMGAPAGMIMEGIVEATYPVPEQTGVNVYAILFNLWALFFLAAGDYITPTMMNWIMCGSVLVTALALLPMKEVYRRSNLDAKGDEYSPLIN